MKALNPNKVIKLERISSGHLALDLTKDIYDNVGKSRDAQALVRLASRDE